MKVICRKCNNLISEDEAIKVNMAEYKTQEQCLIDIPFISLTEQDFHVYTQICPTCWESYNKPKNTHTSARG